MAIRLSSGEIVNVLDMVTTVKEITEDFEISRSSLYMWMYKDEFEWVKVRGTILIDRESFKDFYKSRHNCLDTTDNSK